MKRLAFLLCAALLAAAGTAAAVALAAATTGTVSACATSPAQTIAVNGSPVATVPAAAACTTITYTEPTQTVTTTVPSPTTTATTTIPPAGGLTYDQAIAYTQTPPIFVPLRNISVSSAAALKTAIANLQPGDLVTATAPFTVAGETVIKARLAALAMLDLRGVSFVYSGTSNLPAVWLSNAQNLILLGGDATTSGTGGACILDHGSQHVTWYGFTAHDCGGSGLAVFTVGAPVQNDDFQGSTTRVGEQLAWDPHADKGTGLHAAILWDSGTGYAFTGNRFAIDAHDIKVGACVELGNSTAAAAGGNTLIAECNSNPCRATTQTCGNGLEFWGRTSTLGLDVKYLAVNDYAGYPLYGGGITSGQTAAGVTVEYARAANDKTSPYPAGAPLWDNSHGIVYHDVASTP